MFLTSDALSSLAYMPWFGWIAILGIIAGIIISTVSKLVEGRTNKEVVKRLDAIDAQIAALESKHTTTL